MAGKSGKDTPAIPPESGVSVPDYGEHKGTGYDQTSGADYAIPFLAIMQSNSPQVDGSGADGAKVEGALPGMLMDTVSMELYEAEKEGICFVPCDTQHVFTEWVPREKGGGFVGVVPLDSEVIVKARQAAEKFGKYSHPESGNDLVETFYMYGLHLRSRDDNEAGGMFVVAFTSSKIKKYKQIMYRLRTFKGQPPLYAHRLRITTVGEKNAHGAFKNFKLEPYDDDIPSSLIPPTLGDGEDAKTHPLLLAGKQFREQVRAGLARAAFESQTPTEGTPTGDEVF